MNTTDRSTTVDRFATMKSRWAAGLTHRWAWLVGIALLCLVIGVLIAAIL